MNFLKLLCSLTVLASLVGCATGYKPYSEGSGGYQDKQLDEGVYAVSFSANEKTSAAKAQDYLIKRISEVCNQAGYGFYTIAFTQNMTQSRTETITNANVTENTIFGTKLHASSYDKIHSAPAFYSEAVCYKGPKRQSLGVNTKFLSKEDANNLGVPDRLTAPQILDILSGMNTTLEIGDVILKVNGKRIITMTSLLSSLRNLNPDTKTVNITVIRNSKMMDVLAPVNNLSTTPVTMEKKKAPVKEQQTPFN